MSVQGTFHARVVAARLGAEGILTELRGAVDGIYPTIGRVDVWVDEEGLDDARTLLLADEVEAALADVDLSDLDAPGPSAGAETPHRWGPGLLVNPATWNARRRARLVWILIAAIVLVSLMASTRVV